MPVEARIDEELSKYIKMVDQRGYNDTGLEIIRAFKMGYQLGYAHRIYEELKETNKDGM